MTDRLHLDDLDFIASAPEGAERAMFEDVADELRPGADVLDAGCGTGAVSPKVLELDPTSHVTLLDLSPRMLDLPRDVAGDHLVGSVMELPFDDQSFDVVVSAWVIETVPDPRGAVREYMRVVRPGGRVIYTFCSLPGGWLSRAGSAWLRDAVRRGFAGEFLAEEIQPWHDCEVSHRQRFRGGLTTKIALSSCWTSASRSALEPTWRWRPPTSC